MAQHPRLVLTDEEIHGEICISSVGEHDPRYQKSLHDLIIESVTGEDEDPRIRVIALRLAERVLPLEVSPYLEDEIYDDGRWVTMIIPVDDGAAVAAFDAIMSEAEA